MNIRFLRSPDDTAVREQLDRWRDEHLMQRLWDHDVTVFAPEGTPEVADRLGWLHLPETSRSLIQDLERLRADAVAAGINKLVLCGMGGSSLAPEVFAKTLGDSTGTELTVVDTTHPDALHAISSNIDPTSTWFAISSKSGTTIETVSAMDHFWEQMSEAVDEPGTHFIAVTDPGSPLLDTASERGFRVAFEADPNVGGRYSALTHFGLVPAAIIGIDTAQLLAHASAASAMCGPDTPLHSDPAFLLGASMAVAATSEANKTRFVGDGAGAFVGAWAEQLIAESTGKDGTGIVPVDGGPDRPDATDEYVVAITPTPGDNADVAIALSDPHAIAGVMFILELATAVAGEILGIHPFNQPDVQRAKELAQKAVAGELTADQDAVSIRTSDIDHHVDTVIGVDPSYVAIQAYVAPSDAADDALARLRESITRRTGSATTVGYGPRFLHSTGQLHKGGPDGGAFLQLIDIPQSDIPIPGSEATFSDLIRGQSVGDRSALTDAGRSVLVIDLHDHPVDGIVALANRLAP